MSSASQVVDALIRIYEELCSVVLLTWYNLALRFRLAKTIRQWLTLHVVSVLEQMCCVDRSRFLGTVSCKYDYQLWIDSDIVFDTNKFWQLCDLALPAEGEEKEVVAGWYATEDGSTTSVATLVGGR